MTPDKKNIWVWSLVLAAYVLGTSQVSAQNPSPPPPVDNNLPGTKTQEKKSEDQGDVRWFVWGLPILAVQSFEQATMLGTLENTVSFKGEDFGLQAFITYFFTNEDKLYQAEIQYDENRSGSLERLKDYTTVKDGISALHGPAVSEEFIWSDDLYKKDVENWGVAVAMGHLKIRTEWNTPASVIILDFSGKNFDITLKATYVSKKYLQTPDATGLTPSGMEGAPVTSAP